jgi:threonine dehydrogenase-like Zn-dependent dehydrogenase
VYASDISSSRLDAAADLGATPVSPADVAGIGELEVVVEAIGRGETIMEAIRIVEPHGRVVMLGECWEDWPFRPTSDTMLKDYSVVRSWYFPITEFSENQRLLLDGRVDAAKFISHVFPLEDLKRAYDVFLSGESRKVLARASQ